MNYSLINRFNDQSNKGDGIKSQIETGSLLINTEINKQKRYLYATFYRVDFFFPFKLQCLERKF